MEEHKVTIKEKSRWYNAVEKLLKMGLKTEDNSAEVLI